MILKKPYKFLIKHFKLIHLIIAIMGGYLLIKTNNVLGFFNGYASSTSSYIGTNISGELFNGIIFLFLVLIVLGTTVIALLMKWKEKPILSYLLNLIIYVFVWAIYIYASSVIKSLEVSIIDIRTIKITSDLVLISFILQTISVMFLTIRGLGFDIKKFDFNKDEDLKISTKDSEEFEFEVNIDSNKIRRNLKKNVRNTHYAYQENKFLINIIIIIAVVLIGVFTFLNINVFNKIYKENKTVLTSEYSFMVTDSYIVNTDYRGNKISNSNLVAIKFKIKNNTKDKLELITKRFNLKIKKSTFNPTTDYENKLIDIGKNYIKGNISNEFEEYILVFEVPDEYTDKKIILNYTDKTDKKYKIRIKPTKIKNKEDISSNLNKEIEFNNQILKNVSFKITNYEINDKIKATYNFCETKNKCYESYEYVVPTLSDNYEKAILKIEGTLNLNDQTIKGFKTLADFIETYGTIKYKTDLKEKEMKTSIKEVKSLKSNKVNTYYFEVYKDIKDATQISLILNVRGQKYEYILK